MAGSPLLSCLTFVQLFPLTERELIVSQLALEGFGKQEQGPFEQRPRTDPEFEEVLLILAG